MSRLDTMVAVVMQRTFCVITTKRKPYKNAVNRWAKTYRTVTDLLIDQIEFADVIVLNKLDLVSKEQALEVEAIIKALNPGAEIIPTTRSQVPLERVLDTKLFDYEKRRVLQGWIRELQSEHTPETEEYGISSFTYRTSKPFDADKLHAFINEPKNWEGILRSKGFFWVAADHRIAYEWAQAGGVSSVDATGMWWAAMPRQYWVQPEGQRPDQQPGWHPRYGDRIQMLVFIGQNLDEAEMRSRLDACLLDDVLANADNGTGHHLPIRFQSLK